MPSYELVHGETVVNIRECGRVDAGPCYQIAAVSDGLLCGLVGQIVARLEENCKRLLGDGFVRAGVGCGLV